MFTIPLQKKKIYMFTMLYKKKKRKKWKDIDDMVYEGKTYKRVLMLYI